MKNFLKSWIPALIVGLFIGGVGYADTVLQINGGGTGSNTAQGARTKLLPSQTSANGKVLQSNGTDVSWQTAGAGMVYPGAGIPVSVAGTSWGTSYAVGTMTDGKACSYASSGNTLSCTATIPTVGTLSALTAGTLTDGKMCTYTSSGTLIACNTDIPVITNFATKALDNLASVAMNASLQWDNTAARTFDIAATDNTTVGRALAISAGSTVTGGTADMAGGNLTLNSGLGKGTGASSIIFQTGRTLTTGSTLQTLTTAMTILGNGNVGIGTTGPLSLLSVGGAGSAVFAISGTGSSGGGVYGVSTSSSGVYGNSANSNGVLGISTNGVGGSFSSTNGYGLIVSAGNVGIGTTSPSHKLDVVQTGTTTGLAAIKGLNSGINVGTAYGVYGTATGASQTNVGGYFSATGGVVNNYGLIVDSGNVGIGTTGPTKKFQISDNSGTISLAGASEIASGYGALWFYDTPSVTNYALAQKNLGDLYINTPTTGTNIRMRSANANDLVTILGSGNVGIGTTSPSHKLDVVQTGTTTGLAAIKGLNSGINVGTAYGVYGTATGASQTNVGGYFSATGGVVNNYGLIVDSGNVGIGTTGPTRILHIAGDTPYIRLQNTGTGGQTMEFFAGTSGVGIGTASIAQQFVLLSTAPTNAIYVTDKRLRLGLSEGIEAASGTDLLIKSDTNGTVAKTVAIQGWNGSTWQSVLTAPNKATGNIDLLLVNNSGNVGIGTTGPGSRLTVSYGTQNTSTQPLIQMENPAGAGTGQSGFSFTFGGVLQSQVRADGNGGMVFASKGTQYFGYQNDFSVANDVRFGSFAAPNMVIKGDSGNVGIGTTGPLSKLAINGGLHVGGDSDAGDNNLLVDGATTLTGLAGTGSRAVLADANGLLSAPVSDERLKKNITPINSDVAMRMLTDPTIHGVNYQWKDTSKGDDVELGMVYQSLSPYNIKGLTFFDNGYGGINYDKLGVITFEQNKIQEQEITNLTKRLNALEAKCGK